MKSIDNIARSLPVVSLFVVMTLAPPSLAQGITIMPFGDSITKGFHDPLATRGSYRLELERLFSAASMNFDFVGEFNLAKDGLRDGDHQAAAGYTIGQMTEEFGPSVLEHQPDVVLLLAGTNDHWQSHDFQSFVSQYDSLLSMIHENSPESNIIMSTVPQFGCCQTENASWTEAWVEYRNSVVIPNMNAALKTVAADHDFVDVVDLFSVFDPSTDLGVGDWVHLNIAGHQKLAELFFDRIVAIESQGDFDQDGDLDQDDIDMLTTQVLQESHEVEFDLNDDMLVNHSDRAHWITAIKNTFYGDANLDGRFDSSDLVQVFRNGEYEDSVSQNSSWADGDWSGDQEFDGSDFVLAFQSSAYERNAPALSVPEPGSHTIFLVSFFWKRRR